MTSLDHLLPRVRSVYKGKPLCEWLTESTTRTMGDEMGERYRVTDDVDGVIRATVDAGWVTKPLAEAMCADITEAAARHPGNARLMIDAGALSKATPGAGMYAMRSIKRLNLNGVALYRANGFMRSFARAVMRLAGFRRFGLFATEDDARGWLDRSA